jgi:hypothetical protein
MMTTIAFPDKAIIAALGPFKIEVVRLTGVSDGETYVTRLAQPFAAFMVPATDADSTTQNQSAQVNVAATAATAKTITLFDPAVTGQTLIVIGF